MLPPEQEVQQDSLDSPDESPDELHAPSVEPELANSASEPSPAPGPSLAGTMLTAIGVVGIVLSIVIGILGWRLIGDLGSAAEQSLNLSGAALTTIDRTIVVVRETVGTLGDGLATVEGSLGDASTTLENASDLFDVTADVAATDLPESIASVRAALPPLISSAESITDAIGALSIFGINTGPTQPLAEPIIEIETNLSQLEERLRTQASAITEIASDFDSFSGDATDLADNVGQMKRDLAEAESLLADYESTTANARGAIETTEAEISRTVSTARATVIVLAIMFGLSQAAPIMMGRVLRSGREIG